MSFGNLDAVSHGADHVFYGLYCIPRVISGQQGGALEETVVALQLCDFYSPDRV
ncbi:hypothetical protein [Dialister sp.]|uniref:hypothetical protein n=1 Tax=Dialister sp. TaxID=1955814 RepID=UPI00406D506E